MSNTRFNSTIGGADTPGETYVWTRDSIEVGSESSISVNQAGIYLLTVTNAAGCVGINDVRITANDDVVSELNIRVNPISCGSTTNGYIEIVTIVGGTEPYQFFLDGTEFTGMSIENLTAGDYVVTVVDATDCELSTPATIEEQVTIDIELGPDQELGQGDVALIDLNVIAGTVDSVVWKLGDSVLCTGCLDLSFPVEITTTIIAEAYDENSCVSIDEIVLRVQVLRRVFIPNVFSPNGDGQNDVWIVNGASEVQTIQSMRVFDRWGAMLFESRNVSPGDPGFGWDGYSKGQLAPSGVYVYSVEVVFTDGVIKLFSGDLTLVR